jgi:hypothetical protein
VRNTAAARGRTGGAAASSQLPSDDPLGRAVPRRHPPSRSTRTLPSHSVRSSASQQPVDVVPDSILANRQNAPPRPGLLPRAQTLGVDRWPLLAVEPWIHQHLVVGLKLRTAATAGGPCRQCRNHLLTFRRAHDLDPHRFIRMLNWRLAVRHRHPDSPWLDRSRLRSAMPSRLTHIVRRLRQIGMPKSRPMKPSGYAANGGPRKARRAAPVSDESLTQVGQPPTARATGARRRRGEP